MRLGSATANRQDAGSADERLLGGLDRREAGALLHTQMPVLETSPQPENRPSPNLDTSLLLDAHLSRKD